MNYDANTKQWRKGDLVLHDADAKEPRMLMQVIGYTRSGLCKTQYVFREHRRTIWKNQIAYLHDPSQWLGKGVYRWENHTQSMRQIIQQNFINVKRWNRRRNIGETVITTSSDGGFETVTVSKAIFNQDGSGSAMVRLKRGGWWSLDFVEAVQQQIASSE